MEPLLEEGQILALNHHLPQDIPRGSVVLIQRFGEPPIIKRIVGLPNETISFTCGEVLINRHVLYEPYLPPQVTTFGSKYPLLVTKPNEFVVLGDNRLASEDSRDFGIVHRGDIEAVVDLAFPPPRTLEKPRYRLLLRTKRPFAMAKAVALQRVPDGN